MYSLALLAVSALLLTLAFTPVVRIVCTRLGWLDHPGPRKVHVTPVPRTGGIAILAGYAVAFLILFYSPLGGSRSVAAALPGVWALLPAILVAFATGLLDDVLGLEALDEAPRTGDRRRSLPFMAMSRSTPWPVIPSRPPGGPCPSPCFGSSPVPTPSISSMASMASPLGVGLFATATTFLSALLTGNYALALVTAPLLGALLGFLPYNFNPASIFMGDCGSLPVGFLLGCFGVIWSQKSATLLGMTAPLLALAIPLLDTTLAIARRFLRHQPIFGADRGHIHHRLLARGFTPRRVALYLLCLRRNCGRSLAPPRFRHKPRRRHRPGRVLCRRLARHPIPWI